MSALQSAQKIGNKNSLKIIFILVLLAALWASIQHWGFGPEVEGLKVEQRDFVQTVVASGHVENAHRVDIGAQYTYSPGDYPFTIGETVVVNEVLANSGLAIVPADNLGDAAQKIYAETNHEYPVKVGVERSALVASWGEFTADTKTLAEIAAQRPAAVKIMETVNFDG